MRRLPLFLIAIATLAVVFAGVALFLPSGATGRAPAAETKRPEPHSILDDWQQAGDFIVAFGEVDVPEGSRQLSVAAAGRIVAVPVHSGEHVTAGQTLLELDQRGAQAALAAAAAATEEAQAQVKQAETVRDNHRLQIEQQRQSLAAAAASLEVEKRQLERLRSVPDSPTSSILLLEQQRQKVIAQEAAVEVESLALKQIEREDPTQRVRAAQAALDRTKAEKDAAQVALSNMKIVAPADGTVLRVDGRPGEIVAGGAAAPLIWFVADGPRVVRCEVNHRFSDRVRVGMEALCYRDDSEVLVSQGSVIRVAAWIGEERRPLDRPFRRSDQRSLECLVSLEAPPEDLRIGERLRVVLRTTDPPESSEPVNRTISPSQAER